MAKKGTIGTKIVLEGVNEYNKSLKDIAAQEKLLQSEMKKTQAQFKGVEDSQEALAKKYDVLTKQIELQKKKYEEHQKMVEASAKAQEQYAKKSEDVSAQLKKEEEALEILKEMSGASEESIKEQAEAVEKLKDELAKSEAEYDAAGKKMQQYQTECNKAETGLIELNGQLIDTGKKMAGIEDDADKSADAIEEIGEASKNSGDNVQRFGDVVKANLASEVILDAAKALAKSIGDIATKAVEVGSSFEASMSQVAATMGITASEIANGSKEYQLLADAAKACGEATKYSATEAGEALNYLALAGYDAEKAAATLPKVLDLAAAGGMSLATASDLVTDSMAALAMETDELDKYIDEMAKTSQKSNTSVQQLGEATLVCAGAVSSAGVDLETMNTALGVLANNGIKGAEGGTHLRNVLLSLSAPTEAAEIALNKLGVETTTMGGDLRNLEAILIDLNSALSGMGTADKTRMIKTIFNKTDIAAVNALLKSTSGEFVGLYKEIEHCSGAAANMAETMNDNLKGKVTILQSTLEALGISAYEVFDDELKKGVEHATDAVARLNKSVKEGDMNTSLNKMAMATGELIEKGAIVAEDLLPKIIDGATWCIDNFELIASLIAAIVAKNVAMGTVVPLVEGAVAAWNAYKLANEGATISQWLLNTAMEANPIGLIVTGIAMATAALSAYSLLATDTAQEVDRLNEEQRKLADSATKTADSIRKSSDERKNEIQSIDDQKKHIDKLLDELKQYTNAQGLVVKEQERAAVIVEELNTLIPDLNLYYNEETHYLSQSTEEIKRNTDALWAQAEAAAYQEQMTEIMKDRIEVEMEMAKMEDEVTAARERQTQAQMAYHEALDELNAMENTMTEEYAEQLGKVTELDWARQEEAKRCSEICGPYGELEGQLASLDDQYSIINDRISETDRILDEAERAAEEYSYGTIGALELTEEEYKELYDAVHDSIKGQMDVFAEYEKAQEQNKDQILKNMQSQVEGMESWADDITALAERGIDQGLLKSLAEMGPQGQGYIQAFLKMSDEELQKASQMYAHALSLPDEVAAEVTRTYEDGGYQAYNAWLKGTIEASEEMGADLENNGAELADHSVDGAINEMDDRQDEFDEKGEENFEAYSAGWERAAGISSPSRVMAEIGGYLIEGLIQGVEDNQELAEESAEDAAKSITDTFENGLHSNIFYDFGRDAINGFIDGMKARESAAVRAAKDMADSISGAFKDKMKISSPSKVFEYYGEMTAEGFDEGFRSYLPKIENTMDSLTPQIEENTTSNANTYNNNSNITINVTGAEGQSVEELANAVEERLNDKLNSKEGIYR